MFFILIFLFFFCNSVKSDYLCGEIKTCLSTANKVVTLCRTIISV